MSDIFNILCGCVLADRGGYILLWTAYCVEQEHRRRKLKNEFTNYWKEKG